MTTTRSATGGDAGSAGTVPAGRRRARRWLAPAAAVLAAAGAVAVGAIIGAATSQKEGPLVTEDDPAVPSAVAVPRLHVGQSFCYGLVIVHNPSGQAATLEAVRVQGGTGLSLGTPLALGPDRQETLGTSDACPPGAAAMRRFAVPPGAGPGQDEGVQVLLAFRIERPGKIRVEAVTVTYRAGGERYEVTDTNNLVACTYACEAKPGGR